jgi:hypothetical protein
VNYLRKTDSSFGYSMFVVIVIPPVATVLAGVLLLSSLSLPESSDKTARGGRSGSLRTEGGGLYTAMPFFFACTDKKARAIKLCSAAPAALWCAVGAEKFSASARARRSSFA